MPDPEIQAAVINHARGDMANVPDAANAPAAEYGVREFLGEVKDTLWEVALKLGQQGAAELAQGLMTGGSAYVPYGPGQQPLEVDAQRAEPMRAPEGWATAGGPTDLYGPEAQAPEVAAPSTDSYDRMISAAADRGGVHGQAQEDCMER